MAAVKKLRPEDDTIFKGFVCKREVHEFLFSRTPVDESVAGSSRASPDGLGEVRALIFATRRVRVDSSSSDDDAPSRRSDDLAARALPEKQAVKEFGVQARAGGAVERLSKYHRRRGDYRYEKVRPEVATLVLAYRDDFWWSREKLGEYAATGGDARQPPDVKPELPWGVPSPAAAARAAASTIKREAGETGRAPDGKRRRLASAAEADEVIVLSD